MVDSAAIRMRESNGIAWIEAALGCVRAIFSTRVGGSSPPPRDTLDLGFSPESDPSVVLANRESFCGAIGIRLDDVALCSQVHGTDALLVEAHAAGSGSRSTQSSLGPADSMLRAGPAPALAVQTADCAPIIIAEPQSGAGAAVHAGWRGAAGGIIEKTVAALEELTGTSAASLMAAIGPCVRGDAYEVGPEVHHAFVAWGEEREAVFTRRGGRLALDLGAAVDQALQRCGIPAASVVDSGACTMARPDLFFSHRRDLGQTGRLWGLLV